MQRLSVFFRFIFENSIFEANIVKYCSDNLDQMQEYIAMYIFFSVTEIKMPSDDCKSKPV